MKIVRKTTTLKCLQFLSDLIQTGRYSNGKIHLIFGNKPLCGNSCRKLLEICNEPVNCERCKRLERKLKQ